jgi:hypothetical protein
MVNTMAMWLMKLGLFVVVALLIPVNALAYDTPPVDVIGPANSAEARGGDRESFFPLLKSIAKDRQLPKPYGISLVAAYNAQEYTISEVTMSIDGQQISQDHFDGTKAVPEVKTALLRADVWLLPFLNVYVAGGGLSTDTEITTPPVAPPGPGQTPTVQVLDMKLNGWVINFGAVGAWAWRDFFTTMNLTFSYADLEGEQGLYRTEQFKNWIWDTRVGYRVSQRVNAWLGARWITTKQEYVGTIDNIAFDIKIDQPVWNGLVGTNLSFGERFDISFELGLGERLSGSLNLTYRF